MASDDDELRARATARVGSVLRGKYRLDRILGIGGMATVFAATHTRNKDRVAVKILHPEIAIHKTLRERFLREGYAANSVGHPGTVRVIDDDVAEDGTAFLVMDLLVGETLETRWERSDRHLNSAEVSKLIRGVLEVLAAAHLQGITHRDLKPENLFLTSDGTLKILDFGVARLREISPTRTRSGAVFGTPAFMPPEQAIGRVDEVDAQSDIWAVGATAFTLLSGRYVHEGQTAEEVLINAATKAAPPLATVAPYVADEIASVVDRALLFDKSARWKSAAEMAQALRQATTAKVGYTFDGTDDLTSLAPAPHMTVPPVARSDAHADQATTLPRSTIGGVTSTGKDQHRRVRKTLVAGGAGGLLLIACAAAGAAALSFGHAPKTYAEEVDAAPTTSLGSASASPTESAAATSEASTQGPPPDAAVQAMAASLDTAAMPTNVHPATPPRAVPPRAGPTGMTRLAPSASCTPPFQDIDGVRHWKRGCL
jgi:serine/threonine protein kinase